MNRTIDRLKIIFLGVFAVGVVAIWSYQIFWVWPAKQCEQQHRWWDGATRTCATPLYIPDLTGRPAGVSREEWSKRQAKAQELRERLGERAVADDAKAAPAAKPAEASART